MVSVTPELSSNAVLIVGNQNGVMVWNGSITPPGEAVVPGETLGQTALKSGHSSALSTPPRAGTECERIHHKAVKKAPKNITSEKMNQLMLQRKERSILRPYCPPSLSRAASPNHWNSTQNNQSMPTSTRYLPQSASLIQLAAPKMTNSRPSAADAGWRDGWGT
jgi:hypothetical protein